MSERFLEKDFWFQLRDKTSVSGEIGGRKCADWCTDALRVPEVAQVFSETVAELEARSIGDGFYLKHVHHWLQANIDGVIIIADGTAGQYDPNYPEGYYGPLSKAPSSLRLIYYSRHS